MKLGKVAIVGGASRGIGKDIAPLLPPRALNVVGAFRGRA